MERGLQTRQVLRVVNENSKVKYLVSSNNNASAHFKNIEDLVCYLLGKKILTKQRNIKSCRSGLMMNVWRKVKIKDLKEAKTSKEEE